VELLRIYVVLDGVAPAVWRRVDVPRSLPLDRLHLVLQGAMGWTGVHSHEFETVAVDGSRHPERFLPDDALGGGQVGEREATMPVGRLLGRPGDRLRYVYDSGDEWRHTLRLEQIVPGVDDHPRCVAGARACPPESCGGPSGYRHLLRALAEVPRRDAGTFDVARAQDAVVRLLAAASLPAPAADAHGAGGPARGESSHLGSVVREQHRGTRVSGRVDVLDDLLLRAAGPGDEALSALAHRARTDQPVTIDPTTAARMVAPVAWLVRRVGADGVPLTAAGYLRPVDVAAVASELDLAAEWHGALNREATTVPLLVWREGLQRAGLLRVAQGRLRASRAALELVDDPVGLWWFLAERVPVGTAAERDAGLVVLLDLAGDGAAPLPERPRYPGRAEHPGHPMHAGRPADAGRPEDPGRGDRHRTGAAMHALGWCGRDAGMLAAAEVRATAERTVELLHRLGCFVDAGVLGRRAVPTPEGVLFARAALQTWP
jgi:hypothetical protein